MSADGSIGFVFTRGGRFRVRSTEVKLDHLRLLSVEESLPRIAFIRVPSETILVGLSIECSVPPTWGGIRLHSKELITLGAGQCAHMRTEGPCHWGVIWLPVQEFTRYSSALTGTAIEVPPGVCRWQPRSGPERQFRRLYLAAIRTTHARSGPVIGAEAAHGLEQQLIHLLVECLSSEPASLAAPTMRRGLEVMARFEELIRNRPEGNLSVPHQSNARRFGPARAQIFRGASGYEPDELRPPPQNATGEPRSTPRHSADHTCRGRCETLRIRQPWPVRWRISGVVWRAALRDVAARSAPGDAGYCAPQPRCWDRGPQYRLIYINASTSTPFP